MTHVSQKWSQTRLTNGNRKGLYRSHQFGSLEEARRIIGEFIARDNAEWLIERESRP